MNILFNLYMSGFIATFILTFIQFHFNDERMFLENKEISREEYEAFRMSAKFLKLIIRLVIATSLSIVWFFYIPNQFYCLYKYRNGINI